MTGIMAMLTGGKIGAPFSFGTFLLTKLGLLGSGHTGTFLVNTDGTISHTAAGTGADNSSADTNWYKPTTTNIGNSYYVKFHLNSGDAWSAGLVDGTVYALSSQRSLAWTATTGTRKAASVAVTIYSDAGGTSQVTSGTLTVDVQSDN